MTSEGHSLLAVQLVARIEKHFDLSLPLATLFQGPTIERLAALLDESSRSTSPRQVVVLQPRGGRPPLFLMPSLFGDLIHYQELVRHLGLDQPVYGLLPCAADGTVPTYTRLEDIAERMRQGLQAFRPEGPYCLAGYSFGGPLAYELARQLTAAGQRVALLAVLDTGPLHRRLRSLVDVLGAVPRILGNLPLLLLDDLFRSKPGDLVARLRRKARVLWRKLRGSPVEEAGLDDLFDMDRFAAPLRSRSAMNYRAWSRYEWGPYPGRVTVFRARPRQLWHTGRDLGWGGLAAGGVVIRTVPGHHDSMLKEPHVQVLARCLRDSLDECAAPEACGDALVRS